MHVSPDPQVPLHLEVGDKDVKGPGALGRQVHAVTEAVTVAELPRLPLLSSTLEVIGCIQSTDDKSTNVTRDLNACYLKRQ